MPFTLPELPYGYSDLEPFYDAQTVEIHHSKHHNAYTGKFNVAVEAAGYEGKTVEEILTSLDSAPAAQKGALTNHGGGYYNHKVFFEGLSPNKSNQARVATGNIAEAINKAFGSFDSFKEAFSAKAATHFGSGWVWLVVNASGELEITESHDQICPISSGQKPLLTIDVWEHAYYLKFKNVRPSWVESWWNIVNWDKVNERYGN